MSDYKGYDPLAHPELKDSTTRKCRLCEETKASYGMYDEENFDKCPHCVARHKGIHSVGTLFDIARFCDKARIKDGEIKPGPKFGKWYDV